MGRRQGCPASQRATKEGLWRRGSTANPLHLLCSFSWEVSSEDAERGGNSSRASVQTLKWPSRSSMGERQSLGKPPLSCPHPTLVTGRKGQGQQRAPLLASLPPSLPAYNILTHPRLPGQKSRLGQARPAQREQPGCLVLSRQAGSARQALGQERESPASGRSASTPVGEGRHRAHPTCCLAPSTLAPQKAKTDQRRHAIALGQPHRTNTC